MILNDVKRDLVDLKINMIILSQKNIFVDNINNLKINYWNQIGLFGFQEKPKKFLAGLV